jgi:hypothetical protein
LTIALQPSSKFAYEASAPEHTVALRRFDVFRAAYPLSHQQQSASPSLSSFEIGTAHSHKIQL